MSLSAFQKCINRPFPSSLVPLFQIESKCETFHLKMSSASSFLLMQISHFHTLARFETEAQGSSEMAYSILKFVFEPKNTDIW